MIVKVYSDYKRWVLVESTALVLSAASVSRGDTFSIETGVGCALVRMANHLDHSMLHDDSYFVPPEQSANFAVSRFYPLIARVLYFINFLRFFRYGRGSRRVCLSVEKTAAALRVKKLE